MGRQFPHNSGLRYGYDSNGARVCTGSSMGRADYGRQPGKGLSVRLFRVRIDSQGYDDGGAYWGVGQPLYCATDSADYREFVRAGSRFEACAALDLDPADLAAPLRLPSCYSVRGSQLLYWGEAIPCGGGVFTRANVEQAAVAHFANLIAAKALQGGR